MSSDKNSRLVTENINLIYLVMKRFRNRGIEQDDLFQIGAVGLIKAAQRFDESRGFAFSTYAVPLIIGEIQRFLRDDGMVHISRKIQDDARKIAIIREKYKISENSEISLEELENISGMSKQDIIIAMEADKKAASIENENVLDFLDNKMSTETADKSSETDKVINHIAMKQAFDLLDESERRLIKLRYMQDKTQKDIIITINDNAQDGTDISWLWDVDFDLLGDASIHSITVSGIRCQDMRLRMKYVDIPVMLEENVETAIRKRIEDGVGNLYVLVNYTALFSTHNILKKMEGEKE